TGRFTKPKSRCATTFTDGEPQPSKGRLTRPAHRFKRSAPIAFPQGHFALLDPIKLDTVLWDATSTARP
ncbi:MAG: hypothetical protein ACRD3I_09515, partial [Terriglobales bacterium]